MRKIINFEEATCYDFSKFTEEDFATYKEILESEPFNPALAEFFFREKQLETHHANEIRRHVDVMLSASMNAGTFEIADDCNIEEEYEKKDLMHYLNQVINTLDSACINRTLAYYVEEKSISEIAQADKVSKSAVSQSIRFGEKTLKKIFDVT